MITIRPDIIFNSLGKNSKDFSFKDVIHKTHKSRNVGGYYLH